MTFLVPASFGGLRLPLLAPSPEGRRQANHACRHGAGLVSSRTVEAQIEVLPRPSPSHPGGAVRFSGNCQQAKRGWGVSAGRRPNDHLIHLAKTLGVQTSSDRERKHDERQPLLGEQQVPSSVAPGPSEPGVLRSRLAHRGNRALAVVSAMPRKRYRQTVERPWGVATAIELLLGTLQRLGPPWVSHREGRVQAQRDVCPC